MVESHYYRILLVALFIVPLVSCSRARPAAVDMTPLATRGENRTSTKTNEHPDGLSTPVDSVAAILASIERRTVQAETFLRNGTISSARNELQVALDLLLVYSAGVPQPNVRIDRKIETLLTRLATIDATERVLPAPIDEPAELDVLETLDTNFLEPPEEDIEALNPDLPIELTDSVLSRLEYFTEGRGKSTIEVGLERAGQYRSMIERILDDVGIPRDLIYLAQAESAFKPDALSSARAKGMWQFISSRGSEYGLRQNWWIDERSDPEKSTRAAALHLKDLYNRFEDWYLALAAYNAGPSRVSRAMNRANSDDFWTLSERRLLPQETRNYVPTILAMTIIGRDPTRYGFDITPADALNVERITVDQATDLRVISEYLDISLERIQKLNPHVLRWATPPNIADFELILPSGFGAAFHERITPLTESERILFRHHSVARGETVSHLSARYGVSIDAIAESNNLSNRYTIRIGQSLVIPISGVTAASVVMAETSTASSNTPGDQIPSTYQIQPGDTLWGIANHYGLSIEDIRKWNRMSSTLLITGENLQLESPTDRTAETKGKQLVYNVLPGDTLSEIASFYQISVNEIRSWNLESDLSIIRPGDQLRIYTHE